MNDPAGKPGNDGSLVHASLCGDRESISRLVHEYEHLVFGLCRGVLGNLEAAQDACVSVYKNLRELRSGDAGYREEMLGRLRLATDNL